MSETVPPTLVVLFKRPELHQGKQRLAEVLGAERARQIAEGLLECAIADARRWPGRVVLAPADSKDRDWASRLLPEPEIIPQTAGNLGVRLNALDQALRRQDHYQILYIGSDAPALDQATLIEAGQALHNSDVILGPAEDGGVVLMGNRQPWPDLESLPWSTSKLAATLEQSCLGHGLTCASLTTSFDVDRPKDLTRLNDRLQTDSRSERQQLQQLIRDNSV